jgi:hypothetical protein
VLDDIGVRVRRRAAVHVDVDVPVAAEGDRAVRARNTAEAQAVAVRRGRVGRRAGGREAEYAAGVVEAPTMLVRVATLVKIYSRLVVRIQTRLSGLEAHAQAVDLLLH